MTTTIRRIPDEAPVLIEAEGDLAAVVEAAAHGSVSLAHADIGSGRLDGLGLAGMVFTGANLADVYFVGSSLWRANLQTANCVRADFSGADCSGADFWRAGLAAARFLGAGLCGADFREADLRNAYFRGADLEGAKLDGARLNWDDAHLIAEVLLRAAKDDDHLAFVGRVLLTTLRAENEDWYVQLADAAACDWALAELAKLALPGQRVPECMRGHLPAEVTSEKPHEAAGKAK